MKTIDLRNFDNSLIIHFGTSGHEISASTLANSLLGLSKSINIIDSSINQGSSLEFVVIATGEGSFKVVGKTVRKELNNLFSAESIRVITLSLLSATIWYYMTPKDEINIIVNTNEYIVETKNERIILPRESETYFDLIKNNEKVKKEISNTFEPLSKDSEVDYIEFNSSDNSKEPDLPVPRESFESLANLEKQDEEVESYETDETLIIFKAILEKSMRKWEFKWNGRKISAPILHFDFYRDFAEHIVTVAPNDTLDVRLRVTRRRDNKSGLLVDKEYEVIYVYKHNPAK